MESLINRHEDPKVTRFNMEEEPQTLQKFKGDIFRKTFALYESGKITEQTLELMLQVYAFPIQKQQVTTPIPAAPTPSNDARYVQLYDPADLTEPSHFFDKITDAIRAFPEMSRASLIRVHEQRTVYNGFRCFLVPRNDPAPQEPKDIGPTVASQTRSTGFIAEICNDEITEVFRTQLEAVKARGIHEATVSKSVKYGTIPRNGCRYMRWDEVPEAMKERFDHTRLPVHEASKANGRKLQKIDADTGEVITLYPSQDDARKAENIGLKTIKKCLLDGTAHKGFKWQLVA